MKRISPHAARFRLLKFQSEPLGEYHDGSRVARKFERLTRFRPHAAAVVERLLDDLLRRVRPSRSGGGQ